MSGLDNSQIITDEVSLHAKEAGLTGHQEREHVVPLGTAPADHLGTGDPSEGEPDADGSPATAGE